MIDAPYPELVVPPHRYDDDMTLPLSWIGSCVNVKKLHLISGEDVPLLWSWTNTAIITRRRLQLLVFLRFFGHGCYGLTMFVVTVSGWSMSYHTPASAFASGGDTHELCCSGLGCCRIRTYPCVLRFSLLSTLPVPPSICSYQKPGDADWLFMDVIYLVLMIDRSGILLHGADVPTVAQESLWICLVAYSGDWWRLVRCGFRRWTLNF